jgi:cellulose synthase/poly-beta-1,6-N-acetylglucosamine synthase-like glycosyltransferase
MIPTGILDILIILVFIILFFYSVYNLSIGLIGVRELFISKRKDKKRNKDSIYPFFSLIVPMRNEEKVARRIFKRLLSLKYPQDRYEIIVIEDCSNDTTQDICKYYANSYPDRIRYFHRNLSKGKPSALNYGLSLSSGDIIGVYDADNLPNLDVLDRTAKIFENKEVVAIQGRMRSINSKETTLSNIIHYERILQQHIYTMGKDKMDLFVSFSGTNQFIRKEVLVNIGSWEEKALSEDMELSAKLTDSEYCIKYVPEVICWQEIPTSYNQLINQRLRWYRGSIEVAMKYGRLLRHITKRRIDAELFFISPFIMLLTLFTCFSGLFNYIPALNSQSIFTSFIAQSTSIVTIITLFVLGIGLANIIKPRKIKNIAFLPLVYIYWTLQVFIVSLVFLQLIFKRPKKWIKTKRTGTITENTLI